MNRSSAEERGSNKYLKWRAKKKDFMLQLARGNERRAWEKLREMMLFVNRNFSEVMEDKRSAITQDTNTGSDKYEL